MFIQNLLEKISWKTRKWNVTFHFFDLYLHDGDGTWGFNLASIKVNYHLYCLLSLEFRLPNKTYVKKFVIDHWDFFYLRHFLWNRLENLEDKRTWVGLSKLESVQYKFLGKLFR